jgi:D-beta-D-heptose 7-phosphate kinase/D-beta-D-heptose 1-phosphate adenosyltransferase
MNKTKTLPQLKKVIKKLKKQNKIIVFTNGCFDIIHSGHIKVLREAKKKGNILIVGVNSDSSIKKIKGKTRPILNQKTRTEILSAIEFVDYIVLFKENTPFKLIKEIKPDYLVKGGDWKVDKIIGKEFVRKVFRVKTLPKHSTSSIIARIKNA